ncbi:hypothetical protein OROGR_015159 [Orobanche gracilis]
MTDDGKVKIDKFEGHDFGFWRMQIEEYLYQKGLHEPLTGQKPEKMAEAEWALLDRKALGIVRLSLTRNVAYNIVNEKTTHGLIQTLSNMYEKPTAANKVHLIRQLVNQKMAQGAPVADHINEFNSTISRLGSVDIKFDDEVLALMLLSSLPESWSGVVTTVSSTCGTTKLTYRGIQDMILSEGVRRQNAVGSSDNLLSMEERGRNSNKGGRRGTNKGRGQSRSRNVTCWNCQEKGHFRSQCTKPPAEDKDSKSPGKSDDMEARNSGSSEAVPACGVFPNNTVLSSKHIFELGFFSPVGSTNRYVGIWHKKVTLRTPVWVANRESPLRNSTSGVLTVVPTGQLVIRDGSNNTTVWWSNTSSSTIVVKNPIVQLLDSGNLVIRESSKPGNRMWQSFDYPTDTLLPGMSICWNHVTGTPGRYLSSWRTIDDPSPGGFTFGFDNTSGYPQVLIIGGGVVQYRLGPWNDIEFNTGQRPVFISGLLRNEPVVYYRQEGVDESVISRFTLSPIDVGQQWTWVINRSEEWVFSYSFPADVCDTYRLCGPHGICNNEKNPVCRCLDRFVPKDEQGWVRSGWAGGCVRRTPLNCREDVFLRGGGLEESNDDDLELPIYDLFTVTKATNNFSNSNKLGEGGFGPVYKRMLEDGTEIAVKRLSEFSSQGVDEFKNEVICIAKLQHRSLVKLLGCCIQGDETMLIYEYMINQSLDIILFDKTKIKQLDWSKRFHIINGIARGLLHLHQDSHLRIIHRDLKASNILLDDGMNPKISDFSWSLTSCSGYMSPEYAGDGLFSVKSDVYSFGVLVLEIVSGQRNRGFHHKDHPHNLVGHAWILYKEGKSLELVDPTIVDSVSLNQLLRSIHVALLCVQQCPEERPSMSSVVLMLGSGGVLPEATQPGFFVQRRGFGSKRTTSTNATMQSNDYTITLVEAR